MTDNYYRGVNFTQSWYEDGSKEVGSHCCKGSHPTIQGAYECIFEQSENQEVAANLHGGRFGIRAYDTEDRYRDVEEDELSDAGYY